MASNYTANYGLCQWEPGDKFLREEFNQDNEKLDGAIKAVRDNATAAAQAAQRTADRALSGLEDQGYNIYNLLLQSDYDGKYTGYKKVLLYDGFINESSVASLSAGLLLVGGKPTLYKPAGGETELVCGVGSVYDNNTPQKAAGVTAPEGGSQLYRVKCTWKSNPSYGSGQYTFTLALYRNGVHHHSESQTLTFGGSSQTGYITLKTPMPVGTGDEVHFELPGLPAACMFVVTNDDKYVAASYGFQPSRVSTGTITAKGVSMPACGGIRAWVRHVGGSVTMAVQTAGVGRTLTKVGTRSTADPKGTACTESEFRLDTALPAGSTAPVLNLSLNGAAMARVLDYGLVLL